VWGSTVSLWRVWGKSPANIDFGAFWKRKNSFDGNCYVNFPYAQENVTLIYYKKAQLSQRRPHNAPNIWVPWKISRVLTTPMATFPEICNGLLFQSMLRMCVQNLKFVALPVPEIIGSTQKISAFPGYAHAPISQIFNGLLFAWTLWIYLPNLQSVALAVPEIIAIAVLGCSCEPPILGKVRP